MRTNHFERFNKELQYAWLISVNITISFMRIPVQYRLETTTSYITNPSAIPFIFTKVTFMMHTGHSFEQEHSDSVRYL